jgi:hypothetical protein
MHCMIVAGMLRPVYVQDATGADLLGQRCVSEAVRKHPTTGLGGHPFIRKFGEFPESLTISAGRRPEPTWLELRRTRARGPLPASLDAHPTVAAAVLATAGDQKKVSVVWRHVGDVKRLGNDWLEEVVRR